MLLRFEPETVVVFDVLYIWPLPWGWFVALASPLRHSGAQCAAPGPAIEDPFVRLLSAQFASARNRGNVRRRGAQPNTAQFRPESKRCSNCLCYRPKSFPVWHVVSPTPMYHRRAPGGLLLRARQPSAKTANSPATLDCR